MKKLKSVKEIHKKLTVQDVNELAKNVAVEMGTAGSAFDFNLYRLFQSYFLDLKKRKLINKIVNMDNVELSAPPQNSYQGAAYTPTKTIREFLSSRGICYDVATKCVLNDKDEVIGQYGINSLYLDFIKSGGEISKRKFFDAILSTPKSKPILKKQLKYRKII